MLSMSHAFNANFQISVIAMVSNRDSITRRIKHFLNPLQRLSIHYSKATHDRHTKDPIQRLRASLRKQAGYQLDDSSK
ncbi:MAG: hypothetical protein CMM01_05750 [Rhodopirellula sp.]|nr:hypothetical protein [Rhodopirellula sp.]OUX52099.1 MAG: hypothetical protein CBE43_01310 [Rhodopirellula sp. TMED283]